MKKVLFFLTLLIVLLASSAVAEEWKNVRFPNEPDYVFMIPESYYSIYYGMPDDSRILKDLNMTVDQAEIYLKQNEASIVLYPENLSCTIAIARIIDTDGLNYDEISRKDFLDYADYISDKMGKGFESLDGSIKYTYFPESSGAYGSDFAQYITTTVRATIGISEMMMTQAITVKDGYQTIITLLSENYDHLEENIDVFLDIIDNLVIL